MNKFWIFFLSIISLSACNNHDKPLINKWEIIQRIENSIDVTQPKSKTEIRSVGNTDITNAKCEVEFLKNGDLIITYDGKLLSRISSYTFSSDSIFMTHYSTTCGGISEDYNRVRYFITGSDLTLLSNDSNYTKLKLVE